MAANATGSKPSLARPSGSKTFQRAFPGHHQTAHETPTFTRTPSFAWAPVRGATQYEFELSTSRDFDAENGLCGRAGRVVPTAAVPISLPWSRASPAPRRCTGASAHSAAVQGNRTGALPSASGWDGVVIKQRILRSALRPRECSAGRPSRARAAIRSGSLDIDGSRCNLGPDRCAPSTITNVADLRDFSPGSTVTWAVRALRRVYGQTRNNLPALSYGAWSERHTRCVPAAPSASGVAISDAISPAGSAQAHGLVPGFVFPNDDLPASPRLHRN